MILGQAAPDSTTGELVLYSPPAGFTAKVTSFIAANRTGNSAMFRCRVRAISAADDDRQFVFYDIPVPGNDSFVALGGGSGGAVMSLDEDDAIYVSTASNSTFSFTVFGDEEAK